MLDQIHLSVFGSTRTCWAKSPTRHCCSTRICLAAVPRVCRNIMLKSAGAEGRGVTSKVADFGLSAKMDNTETHMSNVFQVGLANNVYVACVARLHL